MFDLSKHLIKWALQRLKPQPNKQIIFHINTKTYHITQSHSISQSISYSISQSISHSISQSISHSISQSIQSANQIQTQPPLPIAACIIIILLLMDKKQSFKIRQFEWYEVETKVRQIITELFQNFHKKQMEQTIKINQIKRNVSDIGKKLGEHDFLLGRQNAEKPKYLQLQDQKIEQYRRWSMIKEGESESRINRMQEVISVYEERIRQMGLIQRRIDGEIVLREKLFERHAFSIKSELEQISLKFRQQTQQILQFKNTTKGSIGKYQSKIIAFDNRIRQLQDDRKFKTADINKLVEQTNSHHQTINRLERRADNLDERVSDREKDTKLSQKFLMRVKEIQHSFSFMTNFIEQYLPLYNQMQISDTLNSFIQGKQRTKLCMYEQQRFAKLHKKILINDKEGLSEMMGHYSNSIAKIIQRNKAHLIHLKIQNAFQIEGINYQVRQSFQEEDDQEEKKNIVTDLAVSSEEISRVTADTLRAFEHGLQMKLEMQLALNKAWIKQLQEQSTLREVQFDKKQSLLCSKIKDIQIRYQLQQNYTGAEIASLKEKITGFEGTAHNLKQCMRDILNFGSVVNHIVIQDQIDRQSTALYAINSKANGEIMQNQTLQLDSNCLNCQTKNMSLVQQAFKIACLLYNPSQINIDDKSYSREQILQISTNILEKIKKKLSHVDLHSSAQNTLSHVKPANQGQKKEHINHLRQSIQVNSLRKSTSAFKSSISSRNNSRKPQFQTLFPLLAFNKPEKRQRKSHLSVFY